MTDRTIDLLIVGFLGIVVGVVVTLVLLTPDLQDLEEFKDRELEGTSKVKIISDAESKSLGNGAIVEIKPMEQRAFLVGDWGEPGDCFRIETRHLHFRGERDTQEEQ